MQTCLSNGYPVIAIRGLSDLAGRQKGDNTIGLVGSLAAIITANVVIDLLSHYQEIIFLEHYHK